MINALKRAFKTAGKSLSALALAGSMLMPFGTAGCGPKSPPPHVNNAPVLDILVDQNAPVNTSFLYDINASDPDTDVITYSKTSGPTWLNVNPTNGVLSGTPAEADLGSNTSVTVRATDEHGLYDEDSFNILVDSQYTNQAGKEHCIILTNSTYASSPECQQLADIGTREGAITKTYTIEDIVADSTYASGRDTQEKIRFWLQAKKASHPEFESLLILGATDTIPIRGMYGVNPITSMPENDIASDIIYFGDLDDGSETFDWNYTLDNDNDNQFGERHDGTGGADIDMEIDIGVGRIPVHSTAELSNYISKLQAYKYLTNQTTPADKLAFARSKLWLAGRLDGSTDSAPSKDILKIFGEVERVDPMQILVDPLYFKALYETGYGGAEIETKAKVISELNAGKNLVNVHGHGSENDFWAGDSYFDKTDAQALLNSTPSIMYFIACSTGAQNGISDELIVAPKGAVSIIAPSKIGEYQAGGDGYGVSWDYDYYFCNSLFNKNIQNISQALNDSKRDLISSCRSPPPGGNNYRWLNFSNNLSGDPRLNAWTNCNGKLVPNQVARADCTEIDITDGANPVSGADVYIVQGSNIYSAKTGSSGKVIVPVTGAIDKVTTVKQNYETGLIN